VQLKPTREQWILLTDWTAEQLSTIIMEMGTAGSILCSARQPQKRAQTSERSSHLGCSIHFDRADSIAPVDCFGWPVENG